MMLIWTQSTLQVCPPFVRHVTVSHERVMRRSRISTGHSVQRSRLLTRCGAGRQPQPRSACDVPERSLLTVGALVMTSYLTEQDGVCVFVAGIESGRNLDTSSSPIVRRFVR